jgi:hypothetical protein
MVGRYRTGSVERLSVPRSRHSFRRLGRYWEHGGRIHLAGPIEVRKRTGGVRRGRDELGQSGVEMGVYVTILRRTPDHQDLITATDSEVLCRLVVRWVDKVERFL